MEAWAKSGGGKKRGARFRLWSGKLIFRKEKGTDKECKTEVAGWGLAQQRAKQKAFVTLLALAPSPAF